MTKAIDRLNQIAEYQAQIDKLNLEARDAKDAILTPEMKAQMAAIDAEIEGKAETAKKKIAELTEKIKADCLKAGETIKGDHMMVVYRKGTTKIDIDTIIKGLELLKTKYPSIAPEVSDILQIATKVGEPSAALQAIKK